MLEADGYRVTRAAGSLGVWDLVAIGAADVILVQVKSNRGPRPEELGLLMAFPVPPGCRKAIHIWRDYARAAEIRYLD
jgi:hypothetical protein